MHLLAASLCVDTALTLERRLVVGYVREHDRAGANRAQEAAEREGVGRLLASIEADYHGVEELGRHRAPTLPSLANVDMADRTRRLIAAAERRVLLDRAR